jgi:hypothetical protein
MRIDEFKAALLILTEGNCPPEAMKAFVAAMTVADPDQEQVAHRIWELWEGELIEGNRLLRQCMSLRVALVARSIAELDQNQPRNGAPNVAPSAAPPERSGTGQPQKSAGPDSAGPVRDTAPADSGPVQARPIGFRARRSIQ